MTEVKAKMAEKMIKQIMDELSAMRSGQEELDRRVVAIEEKPDVTQSSKGGGKGHRQRWK